MKKAIWLGILVVATIPASASAQLWGVSSMIAIAQNIVSHLIILVGALGLLAFLWGLARFVFKVGGEGQKAVDDGKVFMKWGLIAMFVMVSIWGIIRFIQGELMPGADYSNPNVPSFGNN